MFRYEKKCQGCEKQCKLKSNGYFWNYPQIADIAFHQIDRLHSEFDAVDYAEKLSMICEHYGTTDQPSVVDKHFKIKEMCDGCDMRCRIKAVETDHHYEIQIGPDKISAFRLKNKYDALIKAFDLVQHCAHRTK
jgi:hypothetical protein